MTRIGSSCSLVLAVAAGLGLALWPCAYQEVEATSGVGVERQVCGSMVAVNGVGVLGVLAVPVLLAGVGLVAVTSRRRGVLVVVMVALVVFCVLALASVGVFYVPAAAALVIAVVGWRDLPAPSPATDDPGRAGGGHAA